MMSKPVTSLFRWTLLGGLFALPLLLAGCANQTKGDALQKTLYTYHGAVRWGEIDKAWMMVDPEYREQHPLSGIERSRFDQWEVSSYVEKGRQGMADGDVRSVAEIHVVNRHTQTERGLIDVQTWHWDEATKTWWLTSGLPDYSQAQ